MGTGVYAAGGWRFVEEREDCWICTIEERRERGKGERRERKWVEAEELETSEKKE